MTDTRPPQEPRPEPERPVDELLLRYRQASDADTRRPASQVSEAVRAHAQHRQCRRGVGSFGHGRYDGDVRLAAF